MTGRTSKKVSKTFLPEAFKKVLVDGGCTKNNVHIVVFSDPTRVIRAYDTQSDGGSWNGYYSYVLGQKAASLSRMWVAEGAEFAIPEGEAVVNLSYFCGQEMCPQIYVRNTDLVTMFLGEELAAMVEYPAELPAEVAADWIDERADDLKPRLSPKNYKRMKKVAEQLRELMAVGAAGAAV